jgi:D-alanyl-D-alanine carboxypeptidase/D-alanyl-D-alanine-endopeptidase (penicillin-binding protein 4)
MTCDESLKYHQNRMQHLMFKIIFEISDTRIEFLSNLFSMPIESETGVKVPGKDSDINYSEILHPELKIERDWKKQTNSFTITGNVMDTASTDTFQRNVHDPTLYSGTVFAEMLQNRGININHVIKAPLSPGAIKLAEHRSRPVNHALTEFMKRSENLTAELLVKHIGAVVYDTVGTWNNGLLAIKSFLHDTVGIDTNTFRLSDGSGVSRYNYSSPEHFIKLLTWAYNDKVIRDQFLSTFPIGGWDGTLDDRMKNEDSTVKIIAKTGTLSGVSCLSGYIFTTRGDPLAFSILMNGYVDEAKPFRNLQDRIVSALTDIKL